jgi:hypothetical protein
MWRYGALVCALLGCAALLFASIVLSGAGRHPVAGDGVRKVIHAESLPTYIVLRMGDVANLVGIGGDWGQALAERTFGENFARIREQNRLMLPILYGPAGTKLHGWLKASLYGGPLLLGLALILRTLTPKRFSTFGGKKR